MKYFAIGILLGAIINFMPLFNFETGMKIFPEWSGSISTIQEIRTSPFLKSENQEFSIDLKNSFYILSANGTLKQSRVFENEILHNLSGNGKFYITYEKIGSEIAFYNLNNDVFWKHGTPQYPYLSYNGKLVLLLIADLSGIKILDSNSNIIGAGEISGKLLNSISFTEKNDFASIGFLDGSYYALDSKGEILFSGNCEKDLSVKTTGLSSNGKFIIAHCGSTVSDSLVINDLEKQKNYRIALNDRHLTKTAVCINDDGIFSAINEDKILVSSSGSKKVMSIDIPKQIPGECSISFQNNLFFAVFRTESGSAVYVYDKSGKVIFNKIFQGELFMQQKHAGNSLILRGTDNLYCYTFLK